MLVIYKGNIVLKVALEGDIVRIQPIVGRFDNPQLLKALARNEELLAQVHLTLQDRRDPQAQLTDYFQQRGWQVAKPGK